MVPWKRAGWGPLITIESADPPRRASAVALPIPAPSQFFSDREHRPRLREVYVVENVTGPNGSLHRVVAKLLLVEHEPQNRANFKVFLQLAKDLVLGFKSEIKC